MGESRGAVEYELDGTTTTYDEVSAEGGRVERLLTELFTEHWQAITVGPLIEGAAYEIGFTSAPKVSMLDGYLTIDAGSWHFHLCVNDHRAPPSAELARVRRVARAAFFVTEGGACAGTTWGLRLWNGRGEQMITIMFPTPFYDGEWRPLPEPQWSKLALWNDFRRR